MSQIGLVSSYFFIFVIVLSILPYIPTGIIGTPEVNIFLLFSSDFAFFIVNLIVAIEGVVGISQIKRRVFLIQ